MRWIEEDEKAGERKELIGYDRGEATRRLKTGARKP
jgi:hypothetical protein